MFKCINRVSGSIRFIYRIIKCGTYWYNLRYYCILLNRKCFFHNFPSQCKLDYIGFFWGSHPSAIPAFRFYFRSMMFLSGTFLFPWPTSQKIKMGLGSLEATFETLVDAFVFLDKNKDGYVSKDEMIQAINETATGERSSGRIAMKRFGEFSISW